MKIGVAVGTVILIAALVICLIPFKTVAYTVVIDYEVTGTYYDDEPYQATETYYEDEPYTDTETYFTKEPLDYEVIESYVEEATLTHTSRIEIGGIGEAEETWEEQIYEACVTVQNDDEISGTFVVSFSVSEPFDEFFLERTLYLNPSEAQTAECPAYELGDWSYTVTPSTKSVQKQRTVVKYRQVEKTRVVTRYREVEKQRTVVKQRPETRYKKVTLLDYLISY